MKRKISLILAMAMIVSVLSGMVLVSADGESTSAVETVLDFDFDTAANATAFDTQSKTHTGTDSDTSTQSIQTDSTYGINSYRYFKSGFSFPVYSVTKDSEENAVYTGIERLTSANKFVELEYDIMIVPNHSESASYKGTDIGGVQLTTFDSSNSPKNIHFGSAYYKYVNTSDNTAKTGIWTYESGGDPEGTLTPGANEWHRVKIVTQLTTDTLQSGSTTKYAVPTVSSAINVYIDGELLFSKPLKTNAKNATDEYIKFIRFHSNWGLFGIDNLTVKTYNGSENAPADKGKLVAKLRDFLSNSAYSSYYTDTAVTNAKNVYEKETATAAEISNAISGIDNLISEIKSGKQIFKFDFESDSASETGLSAAQSLANVSGYANYSSYTAPTLETLKDSETYGIGDYLNFKSTFKLPFFTKTEEGTTVVDESNLRTGDDFKDKYFDISFDIMPKGEISNIKNSTTYSNLIGINYNGEAPLMNFGPMYGNKDTNWQSPNANFRFGHDSRTTYKTSYEYGGIYDMFNKNQWYRVRLAVSLTNDGKQYANSTYYTGYNDNLSTATRDSNVVLVYIDGEFKGAVPYYSGSDKTKNLSHLLLECNSSAVAGLDNLSVSLFSKASRDDILDLEVAKDKLTKIIRDIEVSGNVSAESEISSAKALLESGTATATEIENAVSSLKALTNASYKVTGVAFLDTVNKNSRTNPYIGEYVYSSTVKTKIESITVEKIKDDAPAARIIAVLTDANGNVKKCKLIDNINASGTYDVGLVPDEDELEFKYYLVTGSESLTPVKPLRVVPSENLK